MGRKEKIARSIVRAIVKSNGTNKQRSTLLGRILAFFSLFFSLYQLLLRKIRPADFANLRRKHWNVTDDDYVESFQADDGGGEEESLNAIGDMGFSGSVSES